MSRFQGEERGGLKAIFSTMNRKAKQANKYWEHCFGGSQETTQTFSGSREHELTKFLGTMGFINGEQGIKSKKIKGSREHVPPWEGLR